MTRTRRIALKIADWVVQLASPGCQDWAKGLAHEIASIESDRTALRWALGGVRILLDRRDCPIVSLGRVPSDAQEYFARRRRDLTCQAWLCAVIALEFVWIWHAGHAYLPTAKTIGSFELFEAIRSGIPAIVAGLMLFHAICSAAFRRTVPTLRADPRECASIYRDQLLRDIHFMAGWINLLSVAFVLSGLIRMWLEMPRDATLYAQLALAGVLLPAIGLSVYVRVRKLRSRARELDLLLASE